MYKSKLINGARLFLFDGIRSTARMKCEVAEISGEIRHVFDVAWFENGERKTFRTLDFGCAMALFDELARRLNSVEKWRE